MILPEDTISVDNFEVYVEPATVGNKIKLKVNKLITSYTERAIEDNFNGLTRFVSAEEPIYGFFMPNTHLILHLKNDKGNPTVVRNVRITKRSVVNYG